MLPSFHASIIPHASTFTSKAVHSGPQPTGDSTESGFSPIVRRVVASVVGSPVYLNPMGSRNSPARTATRPKREGRFKDQQATLALGDSLCQAYRRAKVRVLADNDGNIIPLLISGTYQVQGQADVNALLLSACIHSAPVDIYTPVSQVPELV